MQVCIFYIFSNYCIIIIFLRAELIKGRDFDWDELMNNASMADPIPVPSNHPLYVLYTSGTTGKFYFIFLIDRLLKIVCFFPQVNLKVLFVIVPDMPLQ